LQAIEKIANELGPSKLIVLEYHTRDQYATPETEALFQSYGSRATPSVFFDGKHGVLGGGDTLTLYNNYLGRINTELAVPSSFSVSATSVPASNLVSARLVNNSPETLNGAQLFVVATQDMGSGEHHYIVRKLASTGVDLAPGQAMEYQLNLEVAGQVVVFLKNSSGSVLQAALLT
jgi:hypothetical protein